MQQGNIFDIQHFGVHDGPGIRSLVFLKGCPLRCAWCCNPESQSPVAQLRYLDFRCKACYHCVSSCPFKAITPQKESVMINFRWCAQCTQKSCLDACNYGAMNLTGYPITVGQLMDILLKEVPFYRNSGGGVTFTGGEPLMQPDFLLACLQECRQRGIHTAIETSGYCKPETFREIANHVDLFLYDIKLIDPQKHQMYTGKPNDWILQNLSWLSESKQSVIIRFPLIPDITDTDQNIGDVIHLMDRLDLQHIDLEPYHVLGMAKYAELGMTITPELIAHDSGYSVEKLTEVKDRFELSGKKNAD